MDRRYTDNPTGAHPQPKDVYVVDRLYMMEKTAGVSTHRVFDRQADGAFASRSYGTENFCRDCHRAAPTDFVFVQFERR